MIENITDNRIEKIGLSIRCEYKLKNLKQQMIDSYKAPIIPHIVNLSTINIEQIEAIQDRYRSPEQRASLENHRDGQDHHNNILDEETFVQNSTSNISVKSKWQTPFTFPDEYLSQDIKSQISKADYKPNDKHIKALIDCIFRKMRDDCGV